MLYCSVYQEFAKFVQNQPYYIDEGYKVFPYGCSKCSEFLGDIIPGFEDNSEEVSQLDDEHFWIPAKRLEEWVEVILSEERQKGELK